MAGQRRRAEEVCLRLAAPWPEEASRKLTVGMRHSPYDIQEKYFHYLKQQSTISLCCRYCTRVVDKPASQMNCSRKIQNESQRVYKAAQYKRRFRTKLTEFCSTASGIQQANRRNHLKNCGRHGLTEQGGHQRQPSRRR